MFAQTFSGKFREIRAKILRTPKNFYTDDSGANALVQVSGIGNS